MEITENKFVQGFYDLKNFFEFKKIIKAESKRANSKMTQLNIKKNWLGDILYVQLNCTDADFMNAGYDYDRMVVMKLKPYVDYLGQELGWSDYLTPQISSFVDDEGHMSLSCAVLFIFDGYSPLRTNLLFGLLGAIGIVGAGVGTLIHYLF